MSTGDIYTHVACSSKDLPVRGWPQPAWPGGRRGVPVYPPSQSYSEWTPSGTPHRYPDTYTEIPTLLHWVLRFRHCFTEFSSLLHGDPDTASLRSRHCFTELQTLLYCALSSRHCFTVHYDSDNASLCTILTLLHRALRSRYCFTVH